jgi:hypothetical protein
MTKTISLKEDLLKASGKLKGLNSHLSLLGN